MKIINKFLIVMMGAMALSCSDFLDEKPEHLIPLDGAIQTIDDCEDYMIGVYSSFKSPGGLAGTAVIAADIQTDFMLPVNNNQRTFDGESSWTFSSQNFAGGSAWTAMYSTVARSNFLLESIPVVKGKIEALLANENASEANKSKYKKDLLRLSDIAAECHMSRALSRVVLVTLFADAYDPDKASEQLALPVWNSSKPGTPTRVYMNEYYDSVLSDIRVASTLSRNGADSKLFTIGAVKALETRVHVYMKNWKAAIESANAVIQGPYKLLSVTPAAGQSVNDSEYGKMWSKDTGEEIIWKIAFTKTDETVSSYGRIFCGLVGQGESRPDFVPTLGILAMYSSTDQRGNIFFKETQTAYTHGLNAHLMYKFPGNYDLDISAAARYGNMPKVFRLSEIYLLRAEAYYMDGNYSAAAMDINALREKRLEGYVHETYSQPELWKMIRDERVRELYMEGHRLYDLKRFKEGFTRTVQTQTQTIPSNLVIQPDNPRFTWPIPQAEIDVPGSKMQKNPSNSVA